MSGYILQLYPEKYLYNYPAFLAKKMHRPDLQEWLTNHEIKTQTRCPNLSQFRYNIRS